MENQQATKSWFIGMLEGEGCFRPFQERNYINDKKGGKGQDCQVRISNTELDIIRTCYAYCFVNGLITYILTAKSKNSRCKPLHELYISGKRDCILLHHLVKDSMQCRINELENIIGASTTTREMSSDLDWLVGAYEAEGCFTINTQYKATGSYHNPAIIFENTNFLMIEKVIRTIKTFELPIYIRDRVQNNPKWKPSKVLTIAGVKRVSRFLKVTENMWIGNKTKRKIALISEFCQSRLSKPQKDPYSEREHEISRLVKTKI